MLSIGNKTDGFSGKFYLAGWDFGLCKLINQGALAESVAGAFNASAAQCGFVSLEIDPKGGGAFRVVIDDGGEFYPRWELRFDRVAQKGAIIDDADGFEGEKESRKKVAEALRKLADDVENPKPDRDEVSVNTWDRMSAGEKVRMRRDDPKAYEELRGSKT